MSTREQPKDTWGAGDFYEPFIGRWSRLVASEFLAWIAVPPGREWLDVGCGTGALTQTILNVASPKSVRGVDPSAGFIEHVRQSITDARASFEVGDAQSLPAGDATVDAAVAALVLNFVPQPERGAAEMARTTRAGGTVAAYVWDYAGKMELLRYFWDAAATLDRDLETEAKRFPICHPDRLAEPFAKAGLRDVETRAIDVPTLFENFDDYWTPFLGGQGPAPSYVASLDYERKTILRDFIRTRLPIKRDGTIPMIARAWAVRGRKG